MAYAAYRDHSITAETTRSDAFLVLDLTIPSVDSFRVRRALSSCEGTGVLRCEPLLHPGGAYGNDAPRVRLWVRLPSSSYASVLHRVLECVPDGEIGHLTDWRRYLRHRNIAHGG
ncbi:MAG: hypothetical protein EOP73_19225 [Variovorax sp.]|jgi:hypothetical protein|nr:MAG: hypothetical protein EOP73_19225 [Variovorax sp.]